MSRFGSRLALAVLALTSASVISAEGAAVKPYWASMADEKVRMRAGPGTDFPIKWVYTRKNLPVQVVAKHSVWRKVKDPGGETGWVFVSLLNSQRTALVTGERIRTMYKKPSATAAVAWRAEPGVVGKISECEDGWCLFDVEGKRGYIRTDHIWGD